MSKPIERSAPFEMVRAAPDGDGLTLEGHAAVFNTPTRIDSWEGTFYEQIAPGAFRKSIRENRPVMQFDHGRHASIGSIPIGAIETLREDAQGLYVNARLHDNALVKPVRDAIESGAIHGMSFRFGVVKDEWRDGKGNLVTDEAAIERMIYARDPKNVPQRTLKEVKVPELGPVVFPAYATTSVAVRDLLANPDGVAELLRAIQELGTPTGAATTATEPGDHSAGSDDEATRRAVSNANALALLPPLSRKDA